MTSRRKLPVGIQDFEKLRTNDYLYAGKPEYMKRLSYLIVFVLFSLTVSGKTPEITQTNQPLSPKAEISLLTCSPTNDAVFTVYGHTALRIYDPVLKIDWVYNYGIFDFSKPNFIYRFAKGETDYMLDTSYFRYFFAEYSSRGSEIYEQVLNLLPEEKEALWQALEWNRRPENRVYRYNFFFDNCATRPVVMIENNIQGYVEYAPAVELQSFRTIINHCTREHPWQTFGCDLALGMPTDRLMTQRETFFIPDNLKQAFDNAKIVREGKAERLVKQSNMLAVENKMPLAPSFITSPVACFSLLFFLILLITYFEWRKKKYFAALDVILFFAAGIAGCILFFLGFISVHPSTFPNMNLLWLHPLHLSGIIFFSIKKFKRAAYWYHFTNFAVILVMSAGWIFIPQHFNLAFIPLIASLWLRSGWALLRK